MSSIDLPAACNCKPLVRSSSSMAIPPASSPLNPHRRTQTNQQQQQGARSVMPPPRSLPSSLGGAPLNPHHRTQTNQQQQGARSVMPPPRSLPYSSSSSSIGGGNHHHGRSRPLLPILRRPFSSRRNHGGAVPPKPRPPVPAVQYYASSSSSTPPPPVVAVVPQRPVQYGSRDSPGESSSSAPASFGCKRVVLEKYSSIQAIQQSSSSAPAPAGPRAGSGSSSSSTLPPSYRFIPTEEELVSYHLVYHARNIPTGVKCIHTVSFYDYSPDQLTGMYEKSDVGIWYLFTRQLMWKYCASGRDEYGAESKRPAVGGYWKRVPGSTQPVLQKVGNVEIGTRQDFDFYGGANYPSRWVRCVKTNWAMHEYRLNRFMSQQFLLGTSTEEELKMGEWVLCLLYERELRDVDALSRQLENNPMDLVCNNLRGRPKRISRPDPPMSSSSSRGYVLMVPSSSSPAPAAMVNTTRALTITDNTNLQQVSHNYINTTRAGDRDHQIYSTAAGISSTKTMLQDRTLVSTSSDHDKLLNPLPIGSSNIHEYNLACAAASTSTQLQQGGGVDHDIAAATRYDVDRDMWVNDDDHVPAYSADGGDHEMPEQAANYLSNNNGNDNNLLQTYHDDHHPSYNWVADHNIPPVPPFDSSSTDHVRTPVVHDVRTSDALISPPESTSCRLPAAETTTFQSAGSVHGRHLLHAGINNNNQPILQYQTRTSDVGSGNNMPAAGTNDQYSSACTATTSQGGVTFLSTAAPPPNNINVADCEMWVDGVGWEYSGRRSGLRPCCSDPSYEPAVLPPPPVVDHTPPPTTDGYYNSSGYTYTRSTTPAAVLLQQQHQLYPSAAHDPVPAPLLTSTNAMDYSHGHGRTEVLILPNSASTTTTTATGGCAGAGEDDQQDMMMCDSGSAAAAAAAFADNGGGTGRPIWSPENMMMSLAGTYFPDEQTWALENYSLDGIRFEDDHHEQQQQQTYNNWHQVGNYNYLQPYDPKIPAAAAPVTAATTTTAANSDQDFDAMISGMLCVDTPTCNNIVDPLSTVQTPPPPPSS